VPHTDEGWVIIELSDGSFEIPGGTLEAGERYAEGLQRELLEEAGAHIISFRPLGYWQCWSENTQPYKPHLAHPEFYRFVGVDKVEPIVQPTNPPDGEQVAAVHIVPLQVAQARFSACGRTDLAELYALAAASVHHPLQYPPSP
jgi:8-oxo-dGTP pyrophosphatase MutT (NUDIX family)